MSLGLSHSLSRYKLKFSPDKVDTMVVQAIGLLDDLENFLDERAVQSEVAVKNRAPAAQTAKAGRTLSVLQWP